MVGGVGWYWSGQDGDMCHASNKYIGHPKRQTKILPISFRYNLSEVTSNRNPSKDSRYFTKMWSLLGRIFIGPLSIV